MKSLIKNELLKFIKLSVTKSSKKAKSNSISSYLLIMGLAGFGFGAMILFFFNGLFPSLIEAKISWVGFTYAIILAVLFSTIGSVFMSQSQLYRAKDNDLLLSLPIPAWQILFCRMIPLYLQNFYFCLIILLPTYIAYALCSTITILSILFFIIALLIIPLLSLTLCCLLGMIVAFIATRVKHANIISVIFSLLFFGIYFAVYSQYNKILSLLLENGGEIAGNIKVFAYPLFLAGSMFEGNALGALITIILCCGLFAILYLILSKTYIGIITHSHASIKHVYREKTLKRTSTWGALIQKESKHFFKSTAYLLNCGLGVVLLFVAAIVIIIFGKAIYISLSESFPTILPYLAPLFCVMICMISAMDGITAPSISLEGKSLYILQSLPIEGYKPLFAKIFFHVLFNTPMAIICGIIAAIVFKASIWLSILFILMPIAVNFLFASLGIVFNLKKPMLDWKNETLVIKQSISVLFYLLSVMLIFGVFVGLFFTVKMFISIEFYLLICCLMISLFAFIVMLWIKKRGQRIFETL